MNLWYGLVGLLPFEWAEPGSMYFMKNALLAILVISPLFALLSTMVVEHRMAFFSDALGHSAFTGIAIGALCGLADSTWCAVALSVVFALLFTLVQQKSKMASDTVIGVFSSTAIALGIFIYTLGGGGSFTKFNSLLIGDILSVSPGKNRPAGGDPGAGGSAVGIPAERADPVRRSPGAGGEPGRPHRIAGGPLQLRRGRGGHPDHDLGGAAGHQLAAGAARRSSPEPGAQYAAVHPALPAGGWSAASAA